MRLDHFGITAREWLAGHIECTADELNIVRLKGSTSSDVYRVNCARDSAADSFVLRVLDNPEWLADEPNLTQHEAAVLREAERAGLNAPHLVAFSRVNVGFGAPVVLMTFLQGHIELNPPDFEGWLDGLARELARIHEHKAEELDWKYQSWVDADELRIPTWTNSPEVWERAIELWQRGAPGFSPVLIHRDYHPTNVLWQNGTVSGVVDWINGCHGPAGVDVGHCRTNLAQMYGIETADRFLAHYQKHAPEFEYNVYWDVDTVLDMVLPSPSFYTPWSEFGLRVLTVDEICQRVDEYLVSLMMRSR